MVSPPKFFMRDPRSITVEIPSLFSGGKRDEQSKMSRTMGRSNGSDV